MTAAFASPQVAGALCRWNVLYVGALVRVPGWMGRLCSATLGRLLRSGPPHEGPVPMGATLDIQRQQQAELLEMQLLHRRAAARSASLPHRRSSSAGLVSGDGRTLCGAQVCPLIAQEF